MQYLVGHGNDDEMWVPLAEKEIVWEQAGTDGVGGTMNIFPKESIKSGITFYEHP